MLAAKVPHCHGDAPSRSTHTQIQQDSVFELT